VLWRRRKALCSPGGARVDQLNLDSADLSGLRFTGARTGSLCAVPAPKRR
jgi:hypothetical protein